MIKFLALDIFDCCIIKNLYYAFVISVSTLGEILRNLIDAVKDFSIYAFVISVSVSPYVETETEMTEKKLDHRILTSQESKL
jgi:HKD family nuclease